MKPALYLRSLRHYATGQLAARVRLRLQFLRYRHLAPSIRLPGLELSVPPAMGLLPSFRWMETPAGRRACLRRWEEIRAGRLTLLGHTVALQGTPNWTEAGPGRLWRFHLHYQDYLPELARVAGDGQAEAARAVGSLVHDWIRQVHPGLLDGWHPYVISLRVGNWLQAWQLLDGWAREAYLGAGFQDSLLEQLAFLARHLEWDVRGNHILTNARALVLGGLAFGHEPWARQGLEVLARQLPQQLLPDGGHHERSAHYHGLVLWHLLDCIALLRRARGSSPSWLDGHAAAMARYLEQVTHPDGEIPLFNDAVLCRPWTVQQLLQTSAEMLGPLGDPPPESGLSTVIPLRSDRHALLIDPGGFPRISPGHAHAGLLGYELSLHGRRIVTDAGVSTYEPGPWRDYFRGTAAHSTVRVDGQDQAELWGAFRVGRPARARLLGRRQLAGSWTAVSLAHDGYRWLPQPVEHRRHFLWHPEGVVVVLDELLGQGAHLLESLVHLGPDARLRLWAEGAALGAEIHDGSAAAWFRLLHPVPLSVERGLEAPRQGWWSDCWREPRPAPVLVMRTRERLPVSWGYALSAVPVLRASLRDDRVEIAVEGIPEVALRLPPGAEEA